MSTKQQIMFTGQVLTRKQRRELIKQLTEREDINKLQTDAGALPIVTNRFGMSHGFLSLPISRPFHRGTGYQLAAANPFAAADVWQAAGPVIGVEQLSGGRAFTFDPWELYRLGLVSSPNLLIQGSLRQGKSFFIKRLVSLLLMFGRHAINTSDSKGEHGVVAEALGGTVFKMGDFNNPLRINPLDAPEQRPGEDDAAYRSRVRSGRLSVLQQISGLLNPNERPVTARELSILGWALDEVVKQTKNQPTIARMLDLIASPRLETADNGYYSRSDARDLQDGFRRLTTGDLAGMFDQHSTVALDPSCPYTVIDTYAISSRGAGALSVTQAVTNAWVHNTISNKQAGRQYFLIREEGWRDMRTVAALEAHQEQLKLSGEYGVAMVLIVHEDGDFNSVGPVGSKERELAMSLLRGYANRICFNQPAPTLERAIEDKVFTPGEAAAIGGLKRGEFLVKLKHRSYLVDGNPTTTDFERVLFDTDKQMRKRSEEQA